MEHELAYCRTPEGFIQVDAAAECGMRFEKVALIHGPDSDNPILAIPVGLGIEAVEKILRDRSKWGRDR